MAIGGPPGLEVDALDGIRLFMTRKSCSSILVVGEDQSDFEDRGTAYLRPACHMRLFLYVL
ncbi:hypothetical protein RSAG8_09219, partial [Rhizoctonia solani AG-8 WAC10335]